MDKTPISQEELTQLMHLPFGEIKALPEDKKAAVFTELGRQITEIPGFVETIQALSEVGPKVAQKIALSSRDIAPFFEKIKQNVSDLASLAREAVYKLLTIDPQQALEAWDALAPYIQEEADANPDKYIQASADELIRAAAVRARADGKDIPPLWVDLPADQPETIDTPAQIIERVQKLPRLAPAAYIMPNNALINDMQDPAFMESLGEKIGFPVIPETSKQKEILAYAMIDYDTEADGLAVSMPHLTEHERNVSNAVISLWVEAEKQGVLPAFTVETIFKAMPGGGEKASAQQKDAISKAFEKLSHMTIKIDATDELRKRGAIREDETFTTGGHFFEARWTRRASKHSKRAMIAYQITSEPIILSYARMTNQILSVPAKYLTIKKVSKGGVISPILVTMNADRQAITGYMMRRIAVMKHDQEAARDRLKAYEKRRKQHPEQELPEKTLKDFRQQRDVILFDAVFKAIGAETDNRAQDKRNRDFCFSVLDYWKATNFIETYNTQTKGKKITGVVIKV